MHVFPRMPEEFSAILDFGPIATAANIHYFHFAIKAIPPPKRASSRFWLFFFWYRNLLSLQFPHSLHRHERPKAPTREIHKRRGRRLRSLRPLSGWVDNCFNNCFGS